MKQLGDIAGVFNISQIVRGSFQSAFLGYYGSARHANQGLMKRGLQLVRAILHIHHVEGLDIGHASRDGRLGVALHDACRVTAISSFCIGGLCRTARCRERLALALGAVASEFGYDAASTNTSVTNLPWKTFCAGAPWSITSGSRQGRSRSLPPKAW